MQTSNTFYPWQQRVFDGSLHKDRRALFAAPRLGKTRVTVAVVMERGFKRTLVLCPLSVCGSWALELESQGAKVLRGYTYPMSSLAAALNRDRDVALVLNYDKVALLTPLLRAWKPEALICDESHYLKTPDSKRSKAVRKLAKNIPFVRLLTGTPTPNHYGDLWGQMVLVDERKWGSSFGDFAYQFLIRDAFYPSRILGHKNVDKLQSMLLQDADIIRREDVFGKDPYQIIERDIKMPLKAQTAYDKIVKEWVLELEQNEEVKADHTLKRLIRLQQAASGYLRTESGADIQIHTAKVEAVISDLDEILEAEEKAVIFHRFTWEGETYQRAVEQAFGVPIYRISGSTSGADRTKAIEDFAKHKGAAIVVAQTQAAGTGISFATATHALFVSQSFSFTDEEQARDRVYAPNKNRCITYYRCMGTVDEFIASVIKAKGNIHEAVTHADVHQMAYGAIGYRKKKKGM